MTNLTIDKVIEMGGNAWERGKMNRVYISRDIFNEITEFGYTLNIKKWKYYIDVATGDIFRTKGKGDILEGNISDF